MIKPCCMCGGIEDWPGQYSYQTGNRICIGCMIVLSNKIGDSLQWWDFTKPQEDDRFDGRFEK